MNKKENKKSNKVIRDMEECFRSFHLPVHKNKSGADLDLAFTSQICNDHFCTPIAAIYCRQSEYVALEIPFVIKVPSEKLADTWRLFNLINEMMPLYHYSIWKSNNGFSLIGGMFLGGDQLSASKYKSFIHDLLEDSYLCFPLIKAVIEGGNPDAIYDKFMKDNLNFVKKINCISKKNKSKILDDVKTALAEMKIINQEEKIFDSPLTNSQCPETNDFRFSHRFEVSDDGKTLIFNLTSSLIVPNEKIPVIMELIGRLNEMSRHDCLYFQRESKRIFLLSGIIIVDGVFDKKEFEVTCDFMLFWGMKVFPIINEQMSSNESPETMIKRVRETIKCN